MVVVVQGWEYLTQNTHIHISSLKHFSIMLLRQKMILSVLFNLNNVFFSLLPRYMKS